MAIAPYQPAVQCPRCWRVDEEQNQLSSPLTMTHCHPGNAESGSVPKCDVPYAHIHVTCPDCGWSMLMMPPPATNPMQMQQQEAKKILKSANRCGVCGRRIRRPGRCRYCKEAM